MLPSQVQSTASTVLRLCKRIDNQCAFFHKNFRKATDQSHYDVLGVPQDASDKDIRKAFIELCKQVHPDADSKDKTLHDKFVKINRAYSVLSKPLDRKVYDEGLAAGLHVEPDEVSTTQNWNPKHPQYYYHPRFYKDPAMRKEAAKAWQQNTGYSFAEYEREDYKKPEGGLSKTALVFICFFLMMFGSLLGYLQYLYAKRIVHEQRQKSAEIEARIKNPDERRVATRRKPMNILNKESLERKKREEELDLSADSIAGPTSIITPEPLKDDIRWMNVGAYEDLRN